MAKRKRYSYDELAQLAIEQAGTIGKLENQLITLGITPITMKELPRR